MEAKKSKIVLLILGMLSIGLLAFNTTERKKIEQIKPVAFKFNLNVLAEASLPEGFADSLKKAEDILSKIFSSKDFKEALHKRNFNDSSFSKSKKDCFDRIYEDNGRVSGKGVYENLTRNQNIQLNWEIKKYTKGPKTRTLGFSNACSEKITSYDYWIKTNQYLSLRMVKHLAHEFTHICGYRHDGRVPKEFKWGQKGTEDPAYGVGGIVGDIMLDWVKKGLI